MTVINTNISATLAANAIKRNDREMTTAMERLSTGMRINSAGDDAAGVRTPVRGAESGERGDEHDPARIWHRAGEGFNLGRRADHFEAIAQPLHGRAGDEYRPFQRVSRLA